MLREAFPRGAATGSAVVRTVRVSCSPAMKFVSRYGVMAHLRVRVSNSGPKAKFGPICNYNLRARSYEMCIRDGPRFMLYL